MEKYDSLKLENQLCFPLYALSKEIVRMYKPLLEKLDLTYTQYITMMVLWEHNKINVKELGEKLYLDSGTLTPLLKKLETKGFITRKRSRKDERNLDIEITSRGLELRDLALSIPGDIAKCVCVDFQKAKEFYETVHLLLDEISKKQ